MSMNTICILGVGLWAIIAFFGISALAVAGKSDEKLGYKTPLVDLLVDLPLESDEYGILSSIPGNVLYETGKSECLRT